MFIGRPPHHVPIVLLELLQQGNHSLHSSSDFSRYSLRSGPKVSPHEKAGSVQELRGPDVVTVGNVEMSKVGMPRHVSDIEKAERAVGAGSKMPS